MRKYTQKELREYIRLKLARDLTTVDPEELPRHYEKIGYKVQEEIAAYEGVKPEEVKLYEFSGFSKIPVYKAV